jgi:bifunctional non-homologous end joining protein LigD
MALEKYTEKRNFEKTPEPAGKKAAKGSFRFVVQRHDASRLHYDFRLELGGVLKSWAVPKGPSLNPQDKRLAMMVEDHPSDYIDFEGRIPEGNYGAGTVIVWDHGQFIPVDKDHNEISEKQALEGIKKGELKFAMKGQKLNGEFVLVQLKKAEQGNAWLLIKHKDEFAKEGYDSEKDMTSKQQKIIAKNAAEDNTGEQPVKKKPSRVKAKTAIVAEAPVKKKPSKKALKN